MKKGLVISILAMLMLTLFSATPTQAVDPNVSIQPKLIQDEAMKPGDPPIESHPSTHQYNAFLTDPANAYDDDQMTSALMNVTQQPYPNKYSRPTSSSGSATNPTNAYDIINATYAAVAIDTTLATKRFNLTAFNTTTLTAVSSLDLSIRYTLTIDAANSNCSYRILLYVGTKNITLVNWISTNVSLPDPIVGFWRAISEPNDGVWSVAEVNGIKISFETQRAENNDRGTLRVYEVWARVYPTNVRYFSVNAFSPTTISGYSYLNVKMNYSAIVGKSSYKILIAVGSANTTVQNWYAISQINPIVVTWEEIAEPNDGWWSQADLSNLKIIIETQKIESEYNNGEIYVYEAWVTIDLPTVNSYPSTNSGTASVTNPTNAYDKNQMTYASINPPATTTQVYFTLTTFNVTTLKNYATINIRMRYTFTAWNCQYRIYLQVGSLTLDLQPLTTVNQTTPILRTWTGVCEPNDGTWSLSDLTSLQVRVAARRTQSTGSYTFGFREYETWVTIPDATLTVRFSITGVVISAPLYGWQFNLTFNPQVLQAAVVSEGPFLKQAGVTQFAGYTISNAAGWVFAGCAVDDWFGGGVYGSGTLATITFQTIAKGNSMFNFTETLLRSFDEVNEIPIPLAHTRSPGWFQYLLGDVNGDAMVDVYDLRQLGIAYGTTSGNPSYDADADQDKDADVDGADLTTVSSNYGDT